MSPASRCDEIIRLIDEALDDHPGTSIGKAAGRGKVDRDGNEQEPERAKRMAS